MRQIHVTPKESHHPLWGGRRLLWVFDEFARDRVLVEVRPDAYGRLGGLFDSEAPPGRYLTDEQAQRIECRVRTVFSVQRFAYENDWALRDPTRLRLQADGRVRRVAADDIPTIERFLQRSGHATLTNAAEVLSAPGLYGCFVGDNLVARARIHEHPDDRSEIAGVYTLPDERGRGIGTALVATCTRAILSRGRIPCCGTAVNNAPMNRALEKAGMEKVSALCSAIESEGEPTTAC